MREIKLRAEYIMLGNKRELRREMLLIRAAAAGIFVCLGVGVASFFSEKLLVLPSFFGGIVLLFFYFSGKLYITGKYYCLSGESTEEPFSLMRASAVSRYALMKTWENAVKFLWLNFFMMPSRFTGIIIIRTFYETGNIQRVMLMTLVSAFLILSGVGILFYFYLSGRYFLSELLFIRCPKQNPFEILKNSALLTIDSLWEIMIFRLKNTFGKGGVTGKMRCALFSSDLFSDRKFYKNYGIRLTGVEPITPDKR